MSCTNASHKFHLVPMINHNSYNNAKSNPGLTLTLRVKVFTRCGAKAECRASLANNSALSFC